MSNQEIAKELNIPIQTVNNVLLGRKVQINNVIKSKILKLINNDSKRNSKGNR